MNGSTSLEEKMEAFALGFFPQTSEHCAYTGMGKICYKFSCFAKLYCKCMKVFMCTVYMYKHVALVCMQLLVCKVDM